MSFIPRGSVLFGFLLLILNVNLTLNNPQTSSSDEVIANRTVIPIAYGLDHGFVNPTIISMTSICHNSKPKTFYEFNIMHPSNNFTEEDKNKILSVKEKYPDCCSIAFINMGNEYINAPSTEHYTISAYYKLSMPSLFPQHAKMIYLDSDTLSLVDLTEMYNLKMKGNYILGHLALKILDFKIFNVTNYNEYVCPGVLLMNLKKMRDNFIEEKAKTMLRDHADLLRFHDQTILNVVCAGSIGFLPPEYGMSNFVNIDIIIQRLKYLKKENIKNVYSLDKYIDAFNSPKLVHFNKIPKPWELFYSYGFGSLFWHYCNKTIIYNEMVDEYTKAFYANERKRRSRQKKGWFKRILEFFKIKKSQTPDL